MKTETALSDIIKEQIKLEKEIGKKLDALESRVDSVAARLLIREMRLDTKKHAEILEATLEHIGGPKSFWDYTVNIDVDKRATKKELDEHIKAEEAMLRKIEEEARKTRDETLKLLLEHFAEDEKRHHKSLETIIRKIKP